MLDVAIDNCLIYNPLRVKAKEKTIESISADESLVMVAPGGKCRDLHDGLLWRKFNAGNLLFSRRICGDNSASCIWFLLFSILWGATEP